MGNNEERIISIIQKQAEVFLLQAKEFFPFGTYINVDNKIVPVGAYFENDRTPSQEIIDLLEKGFRDHLGKGECKIAAIAIDILIRKMDEVYDGMEIRFYEPNKDMHRKLFRYLIKESSVEFIEYYE